jgi:phosphoglycerate kinase
MNLSVLKDVDLKEKRVLMRVDFNVEFENGRPGQKYKILSSKKTIDFVLSHPDVKLALISHLGRPEGKEEELSFANFYKEIGKILEIDLEFVDDCLGEKVKKGLDRLNEKQVLMLENARFFKEDIKCDLSFAEKLSQPFDVFINEAFGVAHRDQCSVTKITQLLPFYAGFNFAQEVAVLSGLREGFKRPAVAIVGGAKVETKVPIIEYFAGIYDYVLAGGRIGLEAIDQDLKFPKNVIMPIDYEGDGLDIGHKTVREFSKIILKAKTIVWNGPLGKFEEPPFDKGSLGVLDAISRNKDAYRVLGGGETIQILEQQNLLKAFDFVSTGGGSMLEFLSKGTLPAIESLAVNTTGEPKK